MVLLLLTAVVAGACTDQDDEPEAKPSKTPSAPVTLEFGVFGPPEEVAAYSSMVAEFNNQNTDKKVSAKVVSWPDRDAAVAAIRSGENVPDVFLASRRDLLRFQEDKLIQPVDDLLDELEVDFGDGFQRDATQAFSADNHLQCMPYGISPMVIYYNTDLIDFDMMDEAGLDRPKSHSSWTFEEFTAAAEYATKGRARGVHIEPTLQGLAPFIYSGGGKLFNDDAEPTSLAFSDGDTREALRETMELLRDPHVTLTQKQLEKQSGVQLFKRGRVGMIAGFRSLTPALREVSGLNFDVMAMPTLQEPRTVGDVTGLCMSADTEDPEAAAEFLAHASSVDSVKKVAAQGYLVPANLEVSESEEFLQPDQMPESSSVFNTSVRNVVSLPLLESYAALEEAVAPSLQRLFYVAILDEVAITEEIDEASRVVLDPEVPGEESSD